MRGEQADQNVPYTQSHDCSTQLFLPLPQVKIYHCAGPPTKYGLLLLKTDYNTEYFSKSTNNLFNIHNLLNVLS